LRHRQRANDVRELLTRYFDTARRLVERYGGVIEKFIGDAVLAVWGPRRPRRR
jgi:class 3 adenylate cyclase